MARIKKILLGCSICFMFSCCTISNEGVTSYTIPHDPESGEMDFAAYDLIAEAWDIEDRDIYEDPDGQRGIILTPTDEAGETWTLKHVDTGGQYTK